jgi:hypothetical protein
MKQLQDKKNTHTKACLQAEIDNRRSEKEENETGKQL